MTKGEVLGDRASALSRVGLPTLHVGLESPARFFEDVAMMGAVLDEPERADEIASFYQARLDRMATTVGAIPTKEKPRVLVAAWHARGGETALKVPAAGWMQTQQVVLAGGEPVWIGETSLSKGWTIVNFEQIAAWDPDLVVLCVSPGQDGAEILARLKSDERWALLRVVQQDGLRLFPSDLYDWNSPDPRWILGSSWMAQTLHPERFADLDLRAEVLAFYGELFGLSAERVEAWILPEVGLGDA
jgi:iron complex transport system substrate-binding protein